MTAPDRHSGGPAAWAPAAGQPAGAWVPGPREQPRPQRIRVLVAVGTDKHPFDRLVEWVGLWHRESAGRVHLTVQHGHTRAGSVPGAVPFLGHAELQDEMARAHLVVCHGGPATILEARRHGHLPIVVPRDPSLGEHVDNHQQLFARRLGVAGTVALCESRESLLGALRAGLDEPGRFAVAEDPRAVAARLAAVQQVGQIVESLVAAAGRGGHRRPWWRRAARRTNGDNGR